MMGGATRRILAGARDELVPARQRDARERSLSSELGVSIAGAQRSPIEILRQLGPVEWRRHRRTGFRPHGVHARDRLPQDVLQVVDVDGAARPLFHRPFDRRFLRMPGRDPRGDDLGHERRRLQRRLGWKRKIDVDAA